MSTPDAAWLLGTTLVFSFVMAAVGGIFGFIAGQAILAQAPGQSNLVAQLPRLKNLGWLFGGSFALLLADAKKLPLPDKFSMLWPWLAYLTGATIGVITAFAYAYIGVGRATRFYNGVRPPEQHLDILTLRFEYLLNGKERYEKARAEAIKTLESATVASAASKQLSELRRLANGLIVTNIYSTLHLLHPGPVAHDSDATRLMAIILKTIETFVRAYAAGRLAGEDDKVRATLMQFVPNSETTEQYAGHRLFTAGMPDDYGGDLVLRQPPSVEGDPIVVPVARDKEHLLPGAPLAFYTQLTKIMNIRERNFPLDCPPPARAPIATYFKRSYFEGIASITSIPIMIGHRGVGILNIETSLPTLVGAGQKEAESIADRLQVPIALLSAFL